MRVAASRSQGTSSSTQSGFAETTSIGRRSGFEASTEATTAVSSAGSTGFVTYRNACSRTARSSVCGASSAVITTTRGREGAPLSRESTSSPSIPGIQTSRSTRSKRSRASRERAEAPSRAVSTS